MLTCRHADVTVRIAIDADGLVTDVTVVAPVGDGFDAAAIAAAKQYLFEPAEFDGAPGPITVETVIHFVIDQAPPPPPPPPPDPGGAVDPAAEGPPSHGGDYRLPIALEGQVVERGTRSVVAGAIVSIKELGLDAITDDAGRFAFHGVAPGPYTVLVVADGISSRSCSGVTTPCAVACNSVVIALPQPHLPPTKPLPPIRPGAPVTV